MSFDPALMTLDGWSNHFVNERLWDDDNEEEVSCRSVPELGDRPTLISLFSSAERRRNSGHTNTEISLCNLHFVTSSCQLPSKEQLILKRGIFGEEEPSLADPQGRASAIPARFPPLSPRPRKTPAAILSAVLDQLNDENYLEDRDMERPQKRKDCLPSNTTQIAKGMERGAPPPASTSVLQEKSSQSYYRIHGNRSANDSVLALEPQSEETATCCEEGTTRFRNYQSEQWDESFEGLLKFRSAHGHCQVPTGFHPNRPLSRWVKRQRHQYKLLMDGRPSTLSENRIQRLEAIGFAWYSHDCTWDRRVLELGEFLRLHGHVDVPTGYKENPQLATWVKQQRRQYKLFCLGHFSRIITLERIEQLQSMGFKWALRTRRERKPEPAVLSS